MRSEAGEGTATAGRCTRLLAPALVLVTTVGFLAGCGAVRHDAAAAPRSERERFLEMFARSYFPGRSGQIFVVPERGAFLLTRPDERYRFMHGSPWDYDVDIPLMLYGPAFVRAGVYREPAVPQDVAPTIATLIGLPVPSTMSGRSLDEAIVAGAPRPRAVLLVVLDGMRVDSFDRLAGRLPNVERLRRDGAWFRDASMNCLPSVTSLGHATLATGTDPRYHGIVANSMFDRRAGETVAPFAGLDPTHLLVPTLADHWNLATDGRAVIVVQGTTPRATGALAGFGGCALSERPFVVAMFDERSAGWVTNADCHRLPDYLRDDRAGPVGDATDGKALLRTARFPGFQADALVEMIRREAIGTDEIPDLVLVNFKTPDYVGHQYGPYSPEAVAALAAMDEAIGRVLAALEAATGPEGYVAVVTADHGMPDEPGPGWTRYYVEDIVEALHDRLDPQGRRLILDFGDPSDCQLTIDSRRLARLGLTLADVARALEELPFVRVAYTETEIRAVRLSR